MRFGGLLVVAALALGGCSVIVNNELDEKDGEGGTDGGTELPQDCEGLGDGTLCDGGGDARSICLAGICLTSTCGDGYHDELGGEACDDGNEAAGDGCEPRTCELSCTEDTDCDDGNPCNGESTCDTDANLCTVGDDAPNGTSCSLDDGNDGLCQDGACLPPGCGNEALEEGEECDDGRNGDDEDGCRDDCTFTCEEDAECNDGSVCNGEETCDVETHTCVAGEELDCTDGDECTEDLCEPETGCSNPLIDEDGDGHAPDSLSCGDDCDDSRDDVYTGAEELCDSVDNDCDGAEDEVAPTWYIDCDGDGFASDTSGAMTTCDEPPPTSCGGGWTSTRPIDQSTTDCLDSNGLVRPNQTKYQTEPASGAGVARDFDYNCDEIERKAYDDAGVTSSWRCSRSLVVFGSSRITPICFGADGWEEDRIPACGNPGTLNECLYDARANDGMGGCVRVRRANYEQPCL